MKKTLFVLTLLMSQQTISFSQCTTCTQTLSTTQTTAITLNPGDKLCITSTGQMNSTLYINGGEVCNEGTINGFIDMTDGAFTNLGQITSGMNISVDKGTFTNFGTIQAAQLSFNGGDLTLLNYGSITGNNFQLLQQTSGALVTFNNSGSLDVTSYMSDSTITNNYGSITTTGQLNNNNYASFYNFGNVQVGANYTNSGYFYTECMIPVGGLWANNVGGIIEGPMSGCGGFSADLSTSNYGSFGMDGSNLDMCDSSNPGSFNFNTGSIGTNVTYCSCTNICINTNDISENGNENQLEIFPNPVLNELNIQNSEAYLNSNYAIFNSIGEIVMDGKISSSSISTSTLTKGVYLLRIDNRTIKFVK